MQGTELQRKRRASNRGGVIMQGTELQRKRRASRLCFLHFN